MGGQDPNFEVEHFQEDIASAVDYCTRLIVKKDPVTRAILEFARPVRGERILDVGTGLGWLPVKLSFYGCDNITGIDISASRIEAARRLAKRMGRDIAFCVGTVETLAPDSFDLVLSICYLHHFYDMSFPLVQIRRILKPEGRCFFYEPNGLWPFAGHRFDRRLRIHPRDGTANETLFSCRGLSRGLRQTGFQVEFLSTNWYQKGLTELMVHLPLKHFGRSIVALARKQ